MEDLLQHFDNPNIMDIKIGTRWDIPLPYMGMHDRQPGEIYHFLIIYVPLVTGNQVRWTINQVRYTFFSYVRIWWAYSMWESCISHSIPILASKYGKQCAIMWKCCKNKTFLMSLSQKHWICGRFKLLYWCFQVSYFQGAVMVMIVC